MLPDGVAIKQRHASSRFVKSFHEGIRGCGFPRSGKARQENCEAFSGHRALDSGGVF